MRETKNPGPLGLLVQKRRLLVRRWQATDGAYWIGNRISHVLPKATWSKLFHKDFLAVLRCYWVPSGTLSWDAVLQENNMVPEEKFLCPNGHWGRSLCYHKNKRKRYLSFLLLKEPTFETRTPSFSYIQTKQKVPRTSSPGSLPVSRKFEFQSQQAAASRHRKNYDSRI